MTTITIPAWGSRGDVDPYTGLGKGLQEAGYHVVLAAQEPYRELVTAAGLDYRPLPADTEQQTKASPGAQELIDGARMRPTKAMLREMVEQMRGVGAAFAEVACDADLLLLPAVATLFGYHVAEGLGIPSMGVHLQPTAPTGDFPPPVLGTRSLGRWGNRTLAKLGGLSEQAYLPMINQLRTDLGLKATKVARYQKRRLAEWPILYGYSEHVVPRPTDWRAGLEVVGYWWPVMPKTWTPPHELLDFLASGPTPIYIGLGSTATLQGERLSEIIGAAVRKAGARAVIQSGWAELHGSGTDMFTVGDVPHEWLFPQMAAIVHHGGAGTTAAALRAGVPAVPVTGIMDQPFWAKRIVDLGAAPGRIRRRELEADDLADLITAAVSEPGYRQRATEIAEQLGSEDGVSRAVDAVNRLLRDIHPHAASPL